MSELRKCRNCGKMYDPSEPWCDHDTMEESAWKDIQERIRNAALDDVIRKAAKDLGLE